MGYLACEQASAEPLAEGSVGAGTGCRVCTLTGNARATKGGIGSACVEIGDDLLVAALVAVNALGEVLDERAESWPDCVPGPAGTISSRCCRSCARCLINDRRTATQSSA